MTRIKWIDVSKALTLILVVLGHTLRTGIVRDMVYAFHVPCFFFLSGLVADEELSGRSILKDAKRLLIPYFSFGLSSIAIYGVLGVFAANHLNMETVPVWENVVCLIYGSSVLDFNAPLWFLPAVFVVKLLYKLTYRLLRGNTFAMLCFAFVGAVASFCYTNLCVVRLPCSFELVLKLFPFFLAGKLLTPIVINIGNATQNKTKCALFGSLLLITACVIGAIAPAVNYTNNAIPAPVVFYIVAALGCMGIYGVSVSLQYIYIYIDKGLSYLGKKSLSVLVMHKFPIVFFQTVGPFRRLLRQPDSLKGVLLAAIPVTVIAVVSSLLVGYIIEKWVPFLLGMSKGRKTNHEVMKNPS